MDKICAVVVTYNRLALLKECVTSLRDQTRKLDEIIVVNNDSADGTKEWLDDQENLTVIHQANLGGAGGFHTGIKTAYEKGYDWIWCMDDDCLVRDDALSNLLKEELNDSIVYNSLVLDPVTKELAFYLVEERSKIFRHFSEISDSKIVNDAAFFNGTFLPRRIVQEIGLPIVELFFRGDEVEYKLRILQNFGVKTISNSVIYHPSENIEEFYCFGIKHLYLQMPAVKKYYYHRNTVYIYKKYKNRNILGMIKNVIFDIFCSLLKLNDYNVALNILKGFLIGLFYNPKRL